MEEDYKRGLQLINRLEYLQYNYFNGRPQWTSIEFKYLKLFMAHTYFGSPFANNEDISDSIDDTSIFQYYKDEEKQCISDIYKIIVEDVIKRDYSNINVGFTITHSICKAKCEVCHNFPANDIHQWYIIRLQLNSDDISYIDVVHGRTYKNWSDYIENNTLPEGYMFYPESGYYEEKNYLFQNLTPPSRTKEKILSFLDLVGTVGNFVSGILLAGGVIFPTLVPMFTIPAIITVSSCSGYDAVRQITKLTNLSQHNQSLIGKQSVEHWINLAISALGVITAPMNVVLRSLEITNSVVMTSKLGRSLSMVQKGICIAQLSLEIVRFTANMINTNVQLTLMDVMALRLDLFVVVGALLPIVYLKEIIVNLSMAFISEPIFTTIMGIPYCLGQHIFTAVRFVKKHFTVFLDHVNKFLKDELTPEKLCLALEMFRDYSNSYVKKLELLNIIDLLKHIVYDIITLSCENAELVKSVLCGQRMTELLDVLNAKNDRCLIRFCVEYVIEKSKNLFSIYCNTVKELSERQIKSVNKINEQFCEQFELEECCMSQFVLYGIKEISKNVQNFLNSYNEYKSKPENQFEEQLVASETNGNQSIKTYTVVAPCGGLDPNTCKQFSNLFDPQKNEYTNYEYLEPKSNISVLYSVSLFCIKMVFFSINTEDGIPSLNISFFRDTQGSMDKRLNFENNDVPIVK